MPKTKSHESEWLENQLDMDRHIQTNYITHNWIDWVPSSLNKG